MPNHTWIPIHREAAEKLLTFKDRQGDLIKLLREMEREGLKVISLKDQNPKGHVHLPALYIELILLGLPSLILANGWIDRMKKG
jgi:hypothetical protein